VAVVDNGRAAVSGSQQPLYLAGDSQRGRHDDTPRGPPARAPAAVHRLRGDDVRLHRQSVHRSRGRRAKRPRRAAFTKRYGRLWLTAGIVLYVAAIGIAVALGLSGAAYLFLPLAVALIYSLGGVKRTFLVKNLVVGLAWGAIPLGVGYYYDRLTSLDILFLFAYVTVMITIAAVVFDVKDIEGDREEDIPTVPNLFGPRATRVGSLVATVAVAVAVVALAATGTIPREFLVVLAMNAYVCAYVPFATPDRGPLYYGFVVDGEHVFLAAVVCALEWLVW